MKDHRDLLMFTRDRIVRGTNSQSETESIHSDSSDEHKFKHNFAIQLAKHAKVEKETTLDYLGFLKSKKKESKEMWSSLQKLVKKKKAIANLGQSSHLQNYP